MAEGQSNDPRDPGFAIGAGLKEARRRIGMDVKEAEERTKIRARYLRALEAEDWEVLPGPAYVRGFLRTYGSLLGLDGAMLADEFRRRHETAGSGGSPLSSEPIRTSRSRGPGGGGPSRGVVAGGVLGVIVVLLIVLGIVGGGDDEPQQDARSGLERGNGGGSGGKRGGGGGGGGGRFSLVLVPDSPITVCLVAGGDALIDSQVLAAGAKQRFGGSRKYRLDLADAGEVRIRSGGEVQELLSTGEQSFEITSEGTREVSYAGPECP